MEKEAVNTNVLTPLVAIDVNAQKVMCSQLMGIIAKVC